MEEKNKKQKSFLFFPGAMFSEKIVKPNTSLLIVFGADGSIGSYEKSFGVEPRLIFQLAPKSQSETVNINGRDLPTYEWNREASYHIQGIIQFKQFIKHVKEMLEAFRKTNKNYQFEFSNPGKGKKIIFEIVEVEGKKYVKLTYMGPGLENKKAVSISLKDPELYFFDYLVQVDNYLPMILSSSIDLITRTTQSIASNKKEKEPKTKKQANFDFDFED